MQHLLVFSSRCCICLFFLPNPPHAVFQLANGLVASSEGHSFFNHYEKLLRTFAASAVHYASAFAIIGA